MAMEDEFEEVIDEARAAKAAEENEKEAFLRAWTEARSQVVEPALKAAQRVASKKGFPTNIEYNHGQLIRLKVGDTATIQFKANARDRDVSLTSGKDVSRRLSLEEIHEDDVVVNAIKEFLYKVASL